MAVQLVTTTEQGGRVIENPSSGKRIAIRQPPPDRSSRLSWELYLAPGGRVPSSHVHPRQEEVFRVVSGRVRFRLGVRRIVAGPGDTVHVPARTVHHFANAGPEEAHISVETEPALEIVGMFEVAASLAQDQYAKGRGRALSGPCRRRRLAGSSTRRSTLSVSNIRGGCQVPLSTPNWPPYGRRTRPGPS